jgi:hypothetical protein
MEFPANIHALTALAQLQQTVRDLQQQNNMVHQGADEINIPTIFLNQNANLHYSISGSESDSNSDSDLTHDVFDNLPETPELGTDSRIDINTDSEIDAQYLSDNSSDDNDNFRIEQIVRPIRRQVASQVMPQVKQQVAQATMTKDLSKYKYNFYNKKKQVTDIEKKFSKLKIAPHQHIPATLFDKNISRCEENNWILPSEMTRDDNMDNDRFNEKLEEITSYAEVNNSIINMDKVDPTEIDENFTAYYNSMNMTVNNITNLILYNTISFYPPQKFMFAFILKSIRYEKRAIKYLVQSPMMDFDIISTTIDAKKTSIPKYMIRFFDEDVYKLLFPKNDLIEMLQNLYPEANPMLFSITDDKTNFDKVVKMFGEDLLFQIPTKPIIFKDVSILSTTLHYAIDLQPEIAKWLINHPLMTEEYINIPYYSTNYGHISMLQHACLLQKFDLVLELSRSRFGKTLINSRAFDQIIKMFSVQQASQYFQEFQELLVDLDISHKSMCILLDEPELFLEILCHKNQKFNKDKYADLVKDVICHRPNILEFLLERYNKEHIPSLAPYLLKYYARENEDLFNNFISQHDPEILKQDKLANILIKRAYDIDFINFDLEFLQKEYKGYNNYTHLCLNNPDIALSLTSILDFDTLRSCIFQLFAIISNNYILETILEHAVNINCVNYLMGMQDNSKNLLLNTIIYNPTMTSVLLPYATEESFKHVDNQGYNIIHLAAAFANVDTVKAIMDCKWWSVDLITQSNINVLECIIHNPDKEVCTLFETIVSNLNVDYKKSFSEAVKNNNLQVVQMIGNNSLFTGAMFSKNIISKCLFNTETINPEIVKYVLNHRHCTINRVKYILQHTNKLQSHIKTFFKNITESSLFLSAASIELMKMVVGREFLIFELATINPEHFNKVMLENEGVSQIINLVSRKNSLAGRAKLLSLVNDNYLLQVIKKNNIQPELIYNLPSSIISGICAKGNYNLVNEINDHYNNIDLYEIPIDNQHFNLVFKSILNLENYDATILNKYLLTDGLNDNALYYIKNNRRVESILSFLVKRQDYATFVNTIHEIILAVINSNKFSGRLLFFNETLFELMVPDINIINAILGKITDNPTIEHILLKFVELSNSQMVDLILSKTKINIEESRILLSVDDDNIFKSILHQLSNISYYTLNTLVRSNNIDQVQMILESKIDLTPIFIFVDPHGNNIITLTPTYNMYKILTKSKYYKPELLASNKAGRSVMSNPNILNGLITDKGKALLTKFKNEIAYMLADNQVTDLDNIKYLLTNIIKKEDVLNDYFVHNIPIKVLSMIKDEDILSIKNKEGQNVLFRHIQDIPAIKKAIGKKIFDKLVIQATNKKKNILMYMLKTKSNVESLYENITAKALKTLKEQVDYKGRNYTFFVREVKYFVDDKTVDFSGKGPLYYDIIKRKGVLFSSFKFNPSMLDILGESALAILCKYAPQVFKQAINCDSLEWRHINKGKNMIKNIIKYNELLMLPLIESCHDISQLIPTIFTDAIRYSPYVLEKILTSKYMEHSLLEICSLDEMHCLEIAFNYQPRSLLLLWKCKHITSKIYNLENSIGYSVVTEMRQIYKKLKNMSVQEILESSALTQYKNVPIWNGDTDSKFVCDLCYLYEKNVRFDKCNHTCCLGCGLKLEKCHLCRQEIEKKTVIFDS